jgi:hypothetical protein
MQFSGLTWLCEIGQARFVTACVAVGAYLNVTVLLAPMAHEPVNVAARMSLIAPPGIG